MAFINLLDKTWYRIGTAFMSPANWVTDSETTIYTQHIVKQIGLPVLQVDYDFIDDNYLHNYTISGEELTGNELELWNAIYNQAVSSFLFSRYADDYPVPEIGSSGKTNKYLFVNTTKASAAELFYLPGQSRLHWTVELNTRNMYINSRANPNEDGGLEHWTSGKIQSTFNIDERSRLFIVRNHKTNAKYSGTVFKESFGLGQVLKRFENSYYFSIIGFYGSEVVDILKDGYDVFFGRIEYNKGVPFNIVTGEKPSNYNPDDGSNIYIEGGITKPTPTNPSYDKDGNKTGDIPQLPGSTNPDFGQLGKGDANTEHSTVDSTKAGLFRCYAMTLAQVQNFGSKLWSAGILDTLAKYFDDPLKVVMGLIEFPFNISATQVGASKEITFSWIPAWANPLNVTGSPLLSEYANIKFGSINVPRYSGTFYDYQPYTTAQLYLPYVGFVPLKYSEIVDGTLSVEYTVSLTAGGAVANVISSKIGVIGTYNCTVGRMLPLSSRDLSSLYLAIAKAAIIGVATAGAGIAAGAAAGSATSAAGLSSAYLDAAVGAESVGAPISADSLLNKAIGYEAKAGIESARAERFSSIAKRGTKAFGSSAINAVANANAPIQRSGSLDAITGRCAKQKPFLLISIPHQNVPSFYNGLIGYPSNIGGQLGDFSGYFEPRSIQIQAPGATSDEIAELEEIIYGGIYIV